MDSRSRRKPMENPRDKRRSKSNSHSIPLRHKNGDWANANRHSRAGQHHIASPLHPRSIHLHKRIPRRENSNLRSAPHTTIADNPRLPLRRIPLQPTSTHTHAHKPSTTSQTNTKKSHPSNHVVHSNPMDPPMDMEPLHGWSTMLLYS